jgi:hypothetical protein
MNKFLSVLILSAASLALNTAAEAHGSSKPVHGGITQMVGETSFELVALADKAEVYLVEEGEDIPSAGMTGKLTITVNGVKSEAALAAADGNKLEAKGVKIPGGAKVAVQVIRKDLSKLTATFTVK